ncbi:MAG: hypothetical protein V4598_02675 [Bdellovibrionota bacterium]
MKSKNLLVLACLISMPVIAQTLPDEINYGPYENTYRVLVQETNSAQSQLNQSRTSLAEAQSFIREMTDHIDSLEAQISSTQSEIARLRREIPSLESQIQQLRNEDSRVMSDLRAQQNEESNLSSRRNQAQNELRPLEAQLQRKEQRLRELQSDLEQSRRQERDAESSLNQTVQEAQRIDRQLEQEQTQQRQLETELRNIETRISSVESEISRAESGMGTLNSNLNTERSKLSALNGRVSDAEAEVSRLRSSGGTPEEISAAERKLGAITNARDNTASEIRSLEQQISRSESQIRTLRSQIDGLRRDQQTLPSRIAQSEARERQLSSQRSQLQSSINRYQSELQTARRNTEVRTAAVDGQRQEIRNDELLVNRHRQLIENLDRQIDVTRRSISDLTLRSRNLNAQIASASELIRTHQAAIPRLEQSIRNDQSEIAEGERDLVKARNDERTFTAAVARDEAKLADVTRRRNAAQNEMDVRANLYNRYLNEAQSLGSGQSANGTTLGEKEGEKISAQLSKQNGVSVGRELGVAEAKHWGSVRGEIQGYETGYAEGLASAEDRARAVSESSAKAAVDAELFAQRNFKPVFFEEFVQEEFKKPLPVTKSLKAFAVLFSRNAEAAFAAVSPLSPNEIAQSENLITPLDSGIVQIAKDVKTISSKAQRLSDPNIAFQAPAQIPFGTANCSQVYKGLAVFKAACDSSYKGSFQNNFVTAAKGTFVQIYNAQFRSEFDAANLSQRESSYPGELKAASVIGRAEGTRIGKIEIFDTTYAANYKTAYATQLEIARTKAKTDAALELVSFLKVKPLLTVAASSLIAENFRGGEEVTILGKVKNVASVGLKGPVIVRITELVNAENVESEAVLNEAGALALTDLPALKVKVLSSAKAGEKMIVRGVVDLPGDLYKPARQEKFELTQVLSANPAHDLGLNYNKTPEIKGVFNRYIHKLTISLKPKFEDIREGYKLTLTPVGETSALVEVKEGPLSTGAIAVGANKEMRFSYVFKDAAKGKTVMMELAISYAGKVIKKENVTVVPK